MSSESHTRVMRGARANSSRLPSAIRSQLSPALIERNKAPSSPVAFRATERMRWSGVPGIEGFLGDDATTTTAGTDPQTILVPFATIDVIANQTNPNITNGGVAEFDLADDVVALQGSGAADYPHLILYLNTTGQSNVTVSYNLRDIDASTDNAVQPIALQYRIGNSGNFTNVPAGFVADATTGPSLATLVTPICVVLPAAVNNQAQVQVRIITANAAGNDEWVGVDDIVVNTAGCGSPLPNLSINDVTVTEGNAGTVMANFTVSLSSPAGVGGVTFDIATADNTATTANNDYVLRSLTGQTIPSGSSTYSFAVTVNGDTTVEPNETFFVNVTNVTGANVLDGQGQGTINNDDVAITLIHDVQGPGATSPLVGNTVTVSGIVTGVKTNGFFVQEEEADYDADPATSEGVLVFTSSAPPAAAAVGNLVQVTGVISEFIPSADPLQPPLTELGSPTVVLISSGNPLPSAVALTTSFPSPAGVHDQLERLEGMRVSVASLTVTGPTLGTVNEPNATATSSGVYYGVVTGNPRPFREAGIQEPDPAPAGTIPPIPRFDSNPERIRVDSDGLVGGPLTDVATGAVVTGLIGPLDYSFRTYTIDPDPGASIGVSGGITPTMVALPTGKEFTVASYNLERFFDTVDDPAIGDPVLTATAFNNRLAKASLGIRDFLRTPDILAVVECENLSTLQSLASRINSDAVAASQPNPLYQAYLVEGNDVGGIDVGFLVKTAIVVAATPRVSVNSVTQFGLGTLFVNPDSSTELLNDRPPLVLDAVVHHPNGASFPVVVIVNHLRSLNGVNSTAPGPNGWATTGDRVRAKRLEQAKYLANLIQARQTANPAEHLVVVGDFNAFEVNDGLCDSMSVIAGTPVPDNQTAVPGDGVDLVNPDLTNLFSSPPPAERYSYVFDGNAQTLDHILINAPLITDTTARREEHPRINADYPETARNNTASVTRLSDHDPVVSYFEVAGFGAADLSITKTDSPDPVTAGNNLAYIVAVANAGPDAAASPSWSDTLPAGTTFVSVAGPPGWTCTTPAIGAGGTVSCSASTLAAAGSASFSLLVNVGAGVASGTVISNTATTTSATADPNAGNNSATTTTTVTTSADLSITKTDSPDPVTAGSNLTYTIVVANAGPSSASTVSWSDTLPAGTTFFSLSSPGGWSCTTPAVGAGGTITCSISSLAALGSGSFTLVVAVGSGVTAGTVISNTATATSSTPDANSANNSATATTTVGASADLSITKADAPDPVNIGANLTYTLVASNAGPSSAASVSVSDTLPSGTTFFSLAVPGGWSCTTPAVGSGGTVSCSIASLPAAGSGTFTLVVAVGVLPGGTVISNTATVTSSTPDGNSGNDSATTTTTVAASSNLNLLKSDAPDPVVAGNTLTYTLTYSNVGGDVANGVVVTETYPAAVSFVSAVPAPEGHQLPLAPPTVCHGARIKGSSADEEDSSRRDALR